LNLVERFAKRVPILLDGEISLNQQYQLKEPLRFEPDTVTIFGAEDQLTRLDFWPTNEFNRNDVEQDFQQTLSLRNASPSITTDIFQTTLVVQVDQVTEKEIYVPILIPDSLTGKIRIFPSEVLVKVNLGLSQYEEVNSDDFKVELKWEPEQKNTLEVEVTTLPDFAVYITHTPKSVDFYRSKSSENEE
jgi:YbbR domain-containing protein